MFVKNQWEKDLAKNLGFKTLLWIISFGVELTFLK